jgi:hypothetical protein
MSVPVTVPLKLYLDSTVPWPAPAGAELTPVAQLATLSLACGLPWPKICRASAAVVGLT